MSEEPPIAKSGSLPFPGPILSEGRDIFTNKLARFQLVLSPEAWFHTANELIAAMKLLEPHIKRYWECLNAQFLGQSRDVEPEHSLQNVHMMLAGFAIENLCKGHLVGRLSLKQQQDVKGGTLPKKLITHDILKLVRQTGMTLSETEKYLVEAIRETIRWRGRYPSPTSHEGIHPFAQMGSYIRRINMLLLKLRRHVGAKHSYRIPPAGEGRS